MSGDGKWVNDDRTWDVANAFNTGIDEIRKSTGGKAKLESMDISQSETLDNLGSAYTNSSEKVGGFDVDKRFTLSREAGNYIRQGELSANFEYLQGIDPLTGFLTERGVRDVLLRRVAHVKRSDNGGFGIVVIDIKNFKYLNDALGHSIGDEVLKLITSKIKDASRGEDAFWRIAGDEYGVIMNADDLAQLHNLIFENRHTHDNQAVEPSWLQNINTEVRSWLEKFVIGKELDGLDLGDAGELRAGVYFVDQSTLGQMGENNDIIGDIILGAKGKLNEVKGEQKSKLMIWKKPD